MTDYIVGLKLEADDNASLIERIQGWGLGETEGVLSVAAQPEQVELPPDLRIAMPQPPMPQPPPPPKPS